MLQQTVPTGNPLLSGKYRPSTEISCRSLTRGKQCCGITSLLGRSWRPRPSIAHGIPCCTSYNCPSKALLPLSTLAWCPWEPNVFLPNFMQARAQLQRCNRCCPASWEMSSGEQLRSSPLQHPQAWQASGSASGSQSGPGEKEGYFTESENDLGWKGSSKII